MNREQLRAAIQGPCPGHLSGGVLVRQVSRAQECEECLAGILERQVEPRGLNLHDLYFVTRRLPRRVVELLQKQPGPPVVAGGFLRSVIERECPTDVDIFAPSKELARSYANVLAAPEAQDGEPWPIYTSPNAYTIRGLGFPVQVIHRWTYGTPEELLASFDFTIAQAAVWWDRTSSGWLSIVGARFYQDLAGKRLVYRSPERNEDAGGTLLRLLKFYARGYTAPLDTVGAVVARLLRGVDEESGQWTQGEDGRARVLTALLREVDPLTDPFRIYHQPTTEGLAARTAELPEEPEIPF